MSALRTDSACATLHAAGWSIGDIGGPGGWIVHGSRGDARIEAHGATQSEAWAMAQELAQSLPSAIVETKHGPACD